MAGLLHIESSPAGDRSASSGIAKVFIDLWSKAHPEQPVDTLNLWATVLPDLDGEPLAARATVEDGQEPSGSQAAAWARLRELAGPVLAADLLLISTPMWNFGIPYRLKHYIDCITQPGLAYRGSPEEGFEGLIPRRPAVLVLSRGGSYPAGSEKEPFDFQRKYLESWLGFLGYRPVETILVERTAAGRKTFALGEQVARKLAGSM